MMKTKEAPKSESLIRDKMLEEFNLGVILSEQERAEHSFSLFDEHLRSMNLNESENPYYEIYKEITKFADDLSMNKWRAYTYFRNLRMKYSYGIPNERALACIAKYSPICEVGAGSGYWASLLSKKGVDIIAYDTVLALEGNNHFYDDKLKPFFDVKECDSTSLFIPPTDRALFLCWPPYDDLMAYNYLEKYQGDTIIYVGEGYYGCTAEETFHESLYNNWEQIEMVNIPRIVTLNDDLRVYRKK